MPSGLSPKIRIFRKQTNKLIDMERREFMQQAGVLALASLLPQISLSQPRPARYKLGLQLFSVNEDMVKDPVGTLKAVKQMGYRDFEIYGFDPKAVTYYGIPATEFKEILDDMGLSVTSGHYGFSDLLREPEQKLVSFVDQGYNFFS